MKLSVEETEKANDMKCAVAVVAAAKRGVERQKEKRRRSLRGRHFTPTTASPSRAASPFPITTTAAQTDRRPRDDTSQIYPPTYLANLPSVRIHVCANSANERGGANLGIQPINLAAFPLPLNLLCVKLC
ncbi:hypothetical protein BKA80DRAFT_123530 [Phyllosticta citrichinensis]